MKSPLVLSEHGQRPVRAIAIATALVCYAAVFVFMVPRHEPWADEAQAWQIARSAESKTTILPESSYHAPMWFTRTP
jgi:hypothetical protein